MVEHRCIIRDGIARSDVSLACHRRVRQNWHILLAACNRHHGALLASLSVSLRIAVAESNRRQDASSAEMTMIHQISSSDTYVARRRQQLIVASGATVTLARSNSRTSAPSYIYIIIYTYMYINAKVSAATPGTTSFCMLRSHLFWSVTHLETWHNSDLLPEWVLQCRSFVKIDVIVMSALFGLDKSLSVIPKSPIISEFG